MPDNTLRNFRNKYSQALRVAIPALLFLFAAALAPLASSRADTITPPERLQKSGTITYCSDIASPPLEYYGADHQPKGSDVDLGNEIAKRMGLKAKWNNVPFAGIVPALLAGHCDAILSQLFDKPKRREVVSFVDYMYSSEAILVKDGNPHNIQSLDDLSGLKVAVENGTTVSSILKEKNGELQKENKKKMDIIIFPRDTDALQQLQIGQVDAYGTTLESAGYYIKKAPNVFSVAGKPFHRILTGIGVRKDEDQLKSAIQKALDSMKQDGTYKTILNKWNLGQEALNQ